jgi:hypothetical protein
VDGALLGMDACSSSAGSPRPAPSAIARPGTWRRPRNAITAQVDCRGPAAEALPGRQRQRSACRWWVCEGPGRAHIWCAAVASDPRRRSSAVRAAPASYPVRRAGDVPPSTQWACSTTSRRWHRDAPRGVTGAAGFVVSRGRCDRLRAADAVPGGSLFTRTVSIQAIVRWTSTTSRGA